MRLQYSKIPRTMPLSSLCLRSRVSVCSKTGHNRGISTQFAAVQPSKGPSEAPVFQLSTKSRIGDIFARYCPKLDPRPFATAAEVFPMRVNNYVLDNLIDWTRVPDDPIFQLVFPQPSMLSTNDFNKVFDAVSAPDATRVSIRQIAEGIRSTLNAHPAGQKQDNIPVMNGRLIEGLQHKYRQTLLFFPMEGQFCHSFCTYCFRWAQFTSVGSDQQMKCSNAKLLHEYISSHPQVTDVLFTGGDPMVMPARILRKYIQPLLGKGSEHLQTIRIGSKSLAYWPWRYLHDSDAKDILTLFSEIVQSGKHLAFQAHFSHPIELSTPVVQEAIRLIRMTGAQIRCQAPLIHRVNDDAEVWKTMWNEQVRLGLIPYYMFVERDTGPREYFSVPLARAYDIFSTAYSQLSGTARTVRGPSMSASPGKVGVLGIDTVGGQKVFVLKFWQARNPEWTKRVFFAQFDPKAIWMDDLRPAFGEKEFFYEEEYSKLRANVGGSSGQSL